MPERINKITALGGIISTWSKIVGTVILLIGYGFLTYYQIKDNSAGISEIKIMLKDQQEISKRELEIISSRSDNRYNRALKAADKIEQINEAQAEQIIELTKEISYLKGRLSDK